MFVVCVKENINGKAEMTRDELQKMLDDAYHKGFGDGYNKGYDDGKNYVNLKLLNERRYPEHDDNWNFTWDTKTSGTF